MLLYILAFISIALGAVGQLFLKMAATSSTGKLIDFYFNLLKTPYTYLGGLSYGASFILWMFLLSKLEVSFLRPLVSVGYIITSLLAFFILNEKITAMRWIGTGLIVAGVAFMVFSVEK
jgi:drug/metabolite transporter (DMT)-like permease